MKTLELKRVEMVVIKYDFHARKSPKGDDDHNVDDELFYKHKALERRRWKITFGFELNLLRLL